MVYKIKCFTLVLSPSNSTNSTLDNQTFTNTHTSTVCPIISKKHPIISCLSVHSLFPPVNKNLCNSLHAGQLQRINGHRPGVNWQLHVATCTVFTQHYGTATVPKSCLVPWVWLLMSDWTCLLLSLSQLGETHTWTPATQVPLLGNEALTAHKQTLNKRIFFQQYGCLQHLCYYDYMKLY